VVNCFVVTRRSRGRGIAEALLAAAVAYAAAHGARLVEGIPVDTGGERMSSASAYTGTRRMFERAGFDETARSTSKASGGKPRVVMRRGT
jgi:GNAT superfamily N-acetyltransferase